MISSKPDSNLENKIYCWEHNTGDKCHERKGIDYFLSRFAFNCFRENLRNECKNNRNTFHITKTFLSPQNSFLKQQDWNSVEKVFPAALLVSQSRRWKWKMFIISKLDEHPAWLFAFAGLQKQKINRLSILIGERNVLSLNNQL